MSPKTECKISISQPVSQFLCQLLHDTFDVSERLTNEVHFLHGYS